MELTTEEWLKLLPLEIRKKIILNDYNIIKNKRTSYYSSMADMINNLCVWSESHDSNFYSNIYNHYKNQEQNHENHKHIMYCLEQDLKKDLALLYKTLSIKVL